MSAEDHYQAQLDIWRDMWVGGRFPALYEAVQLCALRGMPLPEWASLGALNCIRSAYENGLIADEHSRGGAYASPRGRMEKDFCHYLRWVAITNQLVLRGLDDLPAKRGRPSDPDKTRRAVLDAAREVLSSDSARRKLSQPSQTDDSLAASFNEVENSRRAGEARYLLEHLDTLPNP